MASIGEVLAEARRKQGKSIKDAERATKIRSRYIEALENNQFDRIPGDVYVKGFIRSYAQYLGLDSQPLIKQYDVKYTHPLRYETRMPSPITALTPTRRTSSRSFIFAAIAGSVLVIFIGLIIWGVSLGGREKPKGPQPKPKKEVPTAKVTTPTPTPEKVPTTPTQPETEEAKPERLTIKVEITGERCWLRVLADNEKVYEGTLTQGEIREWTAEKEIFIRAGKANAAMVWKNGVKVGPLGTSGGIAEQTFTLEQE